MIKYFTFILLFLTSFDGFAEDLEVNKIVVYKSKREMFLFDKDSNVVKEYNIALGEQPVGHKNQEGDEKTPEGIYYIEKRNDKSRFHLSLKISYPNEQDILQAKERNISPGSNIMIHGLPNFFGWIGKYHLLYDKWTDGCIAVTNKEMKEIWNLVEIGTKIEIKP